MYECFHCGCDSVIEDWDSDFTFMDRFIDKTGIVHVLHCTNCGAYIEYWVPDEPWD